MHKFFQNQNASFPDIKPEASAVVDEKPSRSCSPPDGQAGSKVVNSERVKPFGTADTPSVSTAVTSSDISSAKMDGQAEKNYTDIFRNLASKYGPKSNE